MKIGGLFDSVKIWILAAKNKMKTRMLVAKRIVSNNMPAVVLFFISIAGIFLDLVDRFGENNLVLSYFPKWLVFLAGNLSYSVLVGVIIWFIFTYYYERKLKIIYKRRFLLVYDSFKKQIIQHCLSACERSYDLNLVEKLSDYKSCRSYFEEDDNKRWRSVDSELDNPKHSYREDIMNEYIILQKEISNIVNANIFLGEEAYNWLNNISNGITYHRLEYDSIVRKEHSFYEFDKSFMRDLRSILTQWNFIEGYFEKDSIKEKIEEILTV